MSEEKVNMKKWFNGIQALRGLMFIMVYISHSSKFFDNYGGNGTAGVEVFFIISGLLGGGYAYKLNSSEEKENIITECIKSLWSKIKKFYPVYFVFLIISLPLKFSSWSDFVKCLFLTQSYWGNADTALSFNWPTWFLSSLLLSYFLQPIISRICKTVKKYSCLFIIIIFVIQFLWAYLWRNSSEAYGVGYYMVYQFPVARMLDYLLGNLLYNIVAANEKKNSKYIDSIEIFVILIFIAELLSFKYVPEIYRYTFMWSPISMGLVYIMTRELGKITKILADNKVLLWIGERSFEFYITHRIILGCFSRINNGIVVWILASISTVLVTILMYDWNNNLKKIWR
jgi:peptidoglycan/LPS O-acetylase OafA/YrhL